MVAFTAVGDNEKVIPFSSVKKGMKAVVVAAPSDSTAALRLQEMGLTVGTEIVVKKVAPLGDPIEIELRGYRLCLRKAEASGFMIELVA